MVSCMRTSRLQTKMLMSWADLYSLMYHWEMSRVSDPLTISFIDFSKAFDSIHWMSLWRVIFSYGVPEKVVKVIKCIYVNSHCCVRTEDSLLQLVSGNNWCQARLHSVPYPLCYGNWLGPEESNDQSGYQLVWKKQPVWSWFWWWHHSIVRWYSRS